MSVIGYKCFNEDLTNRYGKKFSIGKIYIAKGTIKFGNNGNGFHLCKNIEDTFRYFDAMKDKISICEVKGSGEIVKFDDDYYGYHDMYAVEQLEIIKMLSHDEIVNIGLNLNSLRAERFVSGIKLNKKDIQKFKNKYKNEIRVLNAIAYYQEGNLKVYSRSRGV